ncbi:hypothetical protein BOX15_Mlig005587g1 [Macrostomum lignano]|uniref:non-specific serine/threonine protein kinase n=1 Tax=Macrostomum lignano TaxID=282301 RepID=A0A267F6R6_9PLAT|nr:hypothetical protein BOX15_Mlig005587g1 [Macrostomum lignano]
MITISKERRVNAEKFISAELQFAKVKDHASYCSLARAYKDGNAKQQCYSHGFGAMTSTSRVNKPRNVDCIDCRSVCYTADDSGIVADYLDLSVNSELSLSSNSGCLLCILSSRNPNEQLQSKTGSDTLAPKNTQEPSAKNWSWTGRSRSVTFIRLPTTTSANCVSVLQTEQVSTSRLGVDDLLWALLRRARDYGLFAHQMPVFFESLCHALARHPRTQKQQQQQLYESQQANQPLNPMQQPNCTFAGTGCIPLKIFTGQYYYRPTHCLGKGNFGQVYMCEVDRLSSFSKREVPVEVFALKVTQHLHTYKMEQWVHQVLQRDHTRESYKSTFLLWMLDCLTIQLSGKGTGCLLLELATGGSLQDLLTGLHTGKQRLLEHEAVFYIAEVGCAIDYMHSRGCLHMDIKADNVLLSASGHVRLADFGHALQLDSLGRACSQLRAGLNTYHLPGEVLRRAPIVNDGVQRGHVVTKATDWFSFGCLAYWLLHNVFPIVPPKSLRTDWTVDQYARYMQSEGYQQLINSNMQVSPAYRQLLLSLLHPRPGFRPRCLSRMLLHHGDVFASLLPPRNSPPICTAEARAGELRRAIESGCLLPPFVPMPLR